MAWTSPSYLDGGGLNDSLSRPISRPMANHFSSDGVNETIVRSSDYSNCRGSINSPTTSLMMDPSASKRRQRSEKMSSFYKDLTDSLHNTVAEYMNDVEVLDDEEELEVVEVRQGLKDLGRIQRDLRGLEKRCMDLFMRGLNEVKAMLQEEVHLRHSSERRLEERCDRIDRELAQVLAQPSSQQITGMQHRLDSLEVAMRDTVDRVATEMETVRQGLAPFRELPRKLQDVNHMLQEEVQIRTNCERHLQERCDHVEQAVNSQRDVQARVNDLKSDATTAHQRIDCLEKIVEEAHGRFTKDLQGFNQLIQQPLPQQQAPPEFHQSGPEKQQQQLPPEFQQPIHNQQPLKMQRELHQPPFSQQPPPDLLRQCSAPLILDGGQELVPVNGLPPQVHRTIAVHRSPSAKSRSVEVRDVRAPSPVRQLPASPAQLMLQQQVGHQSALKVMGLPCDTVTGAHVLEPIAASRGLVQHTTASGQRVPEVRYVL